MQSCVWVCLFIILQRMLVGFTLRACASFIVPEKHLFLYIFSCMGSSWVIWGRLPRMSTTMRTQCLA